MGLPAGFERTFLGLILLLGLSCGTEPVTQTVLRFGDTFTLDVPEGAMIHIVAHRDGERQHEPGHDLGTFPYKPDIKLTMNATDNDGSRRFTVFAELLDVEGERVSWVRVRSGFVQGEISELRIDFASACPDPSDQAAQPDDYDPSFVCGSHDTCTNAPGGGRGICSTACYNPQPYSAVLGDIESEAIQCPERDNLAVERLETGWWYTCALSDSEAFCWGHIAYESLPEIWQRPSRIMNLEGRTTLGEGDMIQDLRASGHVACALTTEGQVRCGGNNYVVSPARIFAGVSIDGDEPCCTVMAPGLPTIRALDGHNYYMCVVSDVDGTVLCSGAVPGPEEAPMVFTPYVVDGETVRGFQTLDGGPQTIGGFGEDGAFRWLRTSFLIDAATPMPRVEDVADVASAWQSYCMVTNDGTLRCWGEDVFEEPVSDQPAVYDGLWSRIAVAEYFDRDLDPDVPASVEFMPHRCAVAMEGSMWCWGNHENGKLGGGLGSPRTFEQRFQVGGATDWVDVAAGTHHTCGLREGGHVYCWGSNDESQLGVRTDSSVIVRVPVPGW